MIARRKRRHLNQIKEEASVQILREKLPESWVIHEYGADYGIDCVVELFDFIDDSQTIAETLGENFFVQLKASSKIDYKTRRCYARGNVAKGSLQENKDDYVDIEVAKFNLEMSEILTVQSMGLAIPVLLVLVDVTSKRAFFVCLNDYIDKVMIPEDTDFKSKQSKTIYIPLKNEILNKEDNLVALRAYGKRSKMYGAFGKFHYQYSEILRSPQYETTPKQFLGMVLKFVEECFHQDIWSGHEFWQPMQWSFEEIQRLHKDLTSGHIPESDYAVLRELCLNVIWHKLTNLNNMYEELVREWFLPTYLAQLTSYPEITEEGC
jgi:hypothetical protein